MKSKKYFRTASDFFSPIDEKQNPKSISLVLIGRLSQQQQPSKKETESRPKGSRHFYRQVALLAGAGVFFPTFCRENLKLDFLLLFFNSPNRIVFLFLPSNFKAGPFP